MEGPTPVSALIHAATMVTAGVYMCTRSAAIFTHAPAPWRRSRSSASRPPFFAATIGLAQNDIKKVFAYSTVSQLGYMFLGVGVGAFSAGIWHLMTHAFFKALLFLGAGSVIHACHGEQDMRHMGGLKKYAPITCWTLACAGWPFRVSVPRASSAKTRFWAPPTRTRPGCTGSACHRGHDGVLRLARLLDDLLGRLQRPRPSARIADWSMLGPLVVLAVLSLVGGFLFNVPKF
jgi:NADH-quinone oxidoreductase subunit L